MILQLLKYLWVLPNTLIFGMLGILNVLTCGKIRIIRGVLEFHGGVISFILHRCTPLEGGVTAITLGHVIYGRNQQCLDLARNHEHVHVRQYEKWGPFFIPAYLLASAFIRCKGGDAYRGNPFEVEAYAKEKDPE